jgi:hypothetical protein
VCVCVCVCVCVPTVIMKTHTGAIRFVAPCLSKAMKWISEQPFSLTRGRTSFKLRTIFSSYPTENKVREHYKDEPDHLSSDNQYQVWESCQTNTQCSQNAASGSYYGWHVQLPMATQRYLNQEIHAAYIFGAMLKALTTFNTWPRPTSYAIERVAEMAHVYLPAFLPSPVRIIPRM